MRLTGGCSTRSTSPISSKFVIYVPCDELSEIARRCYSQKGLIASGSQFFSDTRKHFKRAPRTTLLFDNLNVVSLLDGQTTRCTSPLRSITVVANTAVLLVSQIYFLSSQKTSKTLYHADTPVYFATNCLQLNKVVVLNN